MRLVCIVTLASLGFNPLAVSYNPYPLPDGFPKPNNATALRDIERPAGGLLPSKIPSNLSNNTLKNFRLLASLEFFEIAFYWQLYLNLTHQIPGFELPTLLSLETYTIQSIAHTTAQEQLYALALNRALTNSSIPAIQPCPSYFFPTTSFATSVHLAQTFTDLITAALLSMQSTAASNNEPSAVLLLGSILAQKSAQNAFLRFLQNKLPAGQPFLTHSTSAFAANYIAQRYVEGNCSSAPTAFTETFKPLELLRIPAGPCGNTSAFVPTGMCNQTVRLGWVPVTGGETGLGVVYLNGLTRPQVQNFTVVNSTTEMVVVEVPFPVNASDLYGPTVVVVTNGTGPFLDVREVQEKTMMGPVVVEEEFEYGT